MEEKEVKLEPKKDKKNLAIVLLSVTLILIIAGFVYYYIDNESNKNTSKSKDNVVDKEKEKVESLLITDPLVTGLIYPEHYDDGNRNSDVMSPWSYVNVDLDQMGRKNMMISAGMKLEQDTCTADIVDELTKDTITCVSEEKVKNNYTKIFGPDVKYVAGNVQTTSCGGIDAYYEKSNMYSYVSGCGGMDSRYIKTKLVKAEKTEDKIYTYYNYMFYTNPDNYYAYKDFPKEEIEGEYGLFKDYIAKGDDPDALFNNMINENKLNTYKYTFIKQSDGKYYFNKAEVIKP